MERCILTHFQCACSYKNRPVEGEIQYLDYTRYCKNDVWWRQDPRIGCQEEGYCAYGKFRKMRNTITDIIKNRKREYFSEVSNSLRSSPRSFWSELNTMIPKINMKSIPKDMGAKDFDIHFKNVPDVITSSFTDDSTLFWKGQESIYTFKFNQIQRTDLRLLHCYQIKPVWTSWDLIGSSSRLLVNI